MKNSNECANYKQVINLFLKKKKNYKTTNVNKKESEYLSNQSKLSNEDQQKYTTEKNDDTLTLKTVEDKMNKDEKTTIQEKSKSMYMYIMEE